MNIYRYTLNRESHSQYKYLKNIDFGDREDNHDYSNFRLLSEISRNYFGTSTEKMANFDFSKLVNADLVILVGAPYIGDNVEEGLEYVNEFIKPSYKRYQDMILPTSVFGDAFLLTSTFLNIPTLFVGITDADSINKYRKYVSKPPYYIVSYPDSIMGVLNKINPKKDANVFIIATDKVNYNTKLVNSTLKQVEKELKLYACKID